VSHFLDTVNDNDATVTSRIVLAKTKQQVYSYCVSHVQHVNCTPELQTVTYTTSRMFCYFQDFIYIVLCKINGLSNIITLVIIRNYCNNILSIGLYVIMHLIIVSTIIVLNIMLLLKNS
jgi:hypothetical protein